ncbi:hypothetical protein M8J77_019929 [Diaphorina citri]|nr:hypothetical protein M8J77_003410 [Diaphorina citri]KAI5696752.1 hypothetical protein M8J77_004306 [Diaphorina citri]KAI5755822.1 hypothetical protein M8J77_019929 [Diaphorina citri]
MDGIGEVILHSKYLLYADDFKLFREISDESDYRLLQEDLDSVTRWLENNQLEFSIPKCDVMTITTRKNPVTYEYKIKHSILRRVSSKKDLGVIFQNNLKFDHHVAEISKKAYFGSWERIETRDLRRTPHTSPAPGFLPPFSRIDVRGEKDLFVQMDSKIAALVSSTLTKVV